MSGQKDSKGRFGHLEVAPTAPAAASGEAAREREAIGPADHVSRGQGLEQQGRFDEALQAYSRALRQGAHIEAAWVGQLRCLVAMGEHNEALTWAGRALEYLPQSTDIQSIRCIALARQGRMSEAMALSDKILETGAASPLAWLARAWAHGDARMEAAERCVNKALEMPADAQGTGSEAATFYMAHENHAAALRLLREVTRQRPALAHPWYLQALCLEAIGSVDEAAQAMRNAVRLAPDSRRYRDDAHRLEGANPLVSWWRRMFRK